MLSAHHEGKVLKRKLFTVWICKLPTNIWEASGFLFCLWDKYSGTLPSSVIIQLLVLLNAIKIVLYQWPHAVCDCSFSFNFFSGEVVVAMVIVINSVIGGFCWVDLMWLTASTVQLQVPDNNQLSDYNCTEWIVKNKAENASIIFEEIVMVLIIASTRKNGASLACHISSTATYLFIAYFETVVGSVTF